MKEVTVSDQVYISKLIDIIHANLGNEDFGVNELSHKSGMSLYRLGRETRTMKKRQFISLFVKSDCKKHWRCFRVEH